MGPLPWEYRNLAWVLVAADGLVMGVALVLCILVVRKDRLARNPAFVLLLMCTPIAIGGTVALANYGIAWRVRDHLIVLLVPILARFWSGVRKHLSDGSTAIASGRSANSIR